MLKRFDRMVEYVIIVIYTIIIVAMFAQVVFRYVVNDPLSWSEELARYMFVWLCYLGAYVAVLRNAHVGVDYLTRLMPPMHSERLRRVLALVAIAALLVVLYQGSLLAIDNIGAEWSTIAEFSMAIPYAAVPLGALLLVVGLLRALQVPGGTVQQSAHQAHDV